jgi:DnaJ-class molecular chaperone
MKTLPVICVTCPDCNGRGFVDEKLCDGCDGAKQLVIPDKPVRWSIRWSIRWSSMRRGATRSDLKVD